MDESAASTPSERDRLDRLVARYQARLHYLFDNYRFCVRVRRSTLSFNDSLQASARSLNPRARSKPPRARLNPELELLINHRAREIAAEQRSNSGDPNQHDVNLAAARVLADFKPRRGRPADPLLVHHVAGLMVLHRETCGNELRAGRTRDNLYDPHIKSPLQDKILERFRSIDPRVTMATLAEIIIAVHRTNALAGKRFCDFFPFYGGHVDPDSGDPVPGPGFRLEQFVRLAPIYSS